MTNYLFWSCSSQSISKPLRSTSMQHHLDHVTLLPQCESSDLTDLTEICNSLIANNTCELLRLSHSHIFWLLGIICTLVLYSGITLVSGVSGITIIRPTHWMLCGHIGSLPHTLGELILYTWYIHGYRRRMRSDATSQLRNMWNLTWTMKI